MSLFNEGYRAHPGERAAVMAAGATWLGPDVFEPWTWQTVARFEPQEDGQPAEVQVMAGPARFSRVKVAPVEGADRKKPGIDLSTGSGHGCFVWALQTAKLAAAGMISVEGGRMKTKLTAVLLAVVMAASACAHVGPVPCEDLLTELPWGTVSSAHLCP